MTINKTKPSDPSINGDSLSFKNDIEAEFGKNGGRTLGRYRRDDPAFNNTYPNSSTISNLPLDTGIPTSGEIKFSDFYGKKLNMIVDYHSGANEETRKQNRAKMSATKRFQSKDVKIVGGFKEKSDFSVSVSNASGRFTLTSPTWRGGKKIYVNVNKKLGGEVTNTRNDVALRTGIWPSGTELQVDIGTSGKIYGAGGKGGNASTSLQNNSGSPGQQGGSGTSALGIEYAATINNNGLIRCGYGGGGGGSGVANDPSDKSDTDYGRSGGGGGGGAGFPVGTGGINGTGSFEAGPPATWSTYNGEPGDNALLDAGGLGGDAQSEGGANGGKGGNGGDEVDPAQSGTKGTQDRSGVGYGAPHNAGSGGLDGRAIYYRTQSIRNASDFNGNSVSGRKGGQATGNFQ